MSLAIGCVSAGAVILLSANGRAPADAVPPSPRPVTNGSVSRPTNRSIAVNVVCCERVAISPEACVRFAETLPVKMLPSAPVPPLALNAASSTLPTVRWLTLRP